MAVTLERIQAEQARMGEELRSIRELIEAHHITLLAQMGRMQDNIDALTRVVASFSDRLETLTARVRELEKAK
jgi:chaperonin cofactor prefoldin